MRTQLNGRCIIPVSQTPGEHLLNYGLNIRTIVSLSVPVPPCHHAVDHKSNRTECRNKREISRSTARLSALEIQDVDEIGNNRKKDSH